MLLYFDAEYRVVVNDQVHSLHVRSEAIGSDSGAERGHIGLVLGTSAERSAADERARLQAQLQHARRLESLGLLAGGVAHDFNNLLVGILANASLARDEVASNPAACEALDDIMQAAQRAADITRQLLAYGGRAWVDRQQVMLTPLSRDLPQVLGARVPAHVTVTVCGDEDVAVDGDETQLRQVLLNLVTNAVDAVGTAPGEVSVSITSRDFTHEELERCLLGRERPAGRYAVVAVHDSGGGMSADVQERMFDPFFTTKSNGRGLGLAATLGILKRHDGAIQVDSAEGVGTTIQALLPIGSRRTTPRGLVAVEEGPVGRGIVLLVDDDTNARTAARRILTRAGFTVHEAENGADALRVLDALPEPPRVVVLDVSMPIMNGDECLQILRSRGCTVPVLMSSGYDADDAASHLIAPGETHFLQKPYTPRALLAALAELMAST